MCISNNVKTFKKWLNTTGKNINLKMYQNCIILYQIFKNVFVYYKL